MKQFIEWLVHIWRRIHKPREGWEIKMVSEHTNKKEVDIDTNISKDVETVRLSKDVPRGTEKKPRPNIRLVLKRKVFTENSTIGDLYFDRKYQCKILEDPWRDPDNSGQLDKDEKIYGVTCIPTGVYRVVWSFSNRFQKELPELLEVPHFSGIRIHGGNRPEDTLGCLITGTKAGEDVVFLSQRAYKIITPVLKAAIKQSKVFISVENHKGEALEPTT